MNAHEFDNTENPLTWWLCLQYLHCYPTNPNHLGCRNKVIPEPPEPKQNINMGKHAHATAD